ncbi:lytic transglycosylase domain-containing protein [Limnobacter humi]|uniref:Lytic transglycosylase domain-containing protein n=1 Tax=Limnobacter humi TaxID=1778671 RepID=A0ABT1WBE7_9BURK|nr:lytic transglycosylase domain-containing protein [Limnobacter humi]MCQ8894835.1 lytic transglycosylase domain-containing protein [Limnobacter humi]
MLTSLIGWPTETRAQATALNDQTDQGELMRQIKSAYADGRYADFSRLAAKLPANHIFRPYIDIWQFRFFQKGQEKANPDEQLIWKTDDVLPLLNRYPSSWPAEQLRREWLQQLARGGQWALFAEQRPQLKYRADQGVECADMLYASTQGQLVQSKLNTVLSSDKKLPRTCRMLLRNLYDRGAINGSDLDKHILHLAEGKQPGAAQQFVDEMADTAWGRNLDGKLLIQAFDSPDKMLKNLTGRGTDLYIGVALTRKAVEDYDAAARLLDTDLKGKLSDRTERWLWGHIGYRAGLVWNPMSENYFKRSSADVLGPEQQEWKVRSALLQEDWPTVLAFINEMSPDLQDNRTWQYWKGRALAANGKVVEARQEWIRAANTFSFYGKLANEELGATVSAPNKPAALTAAELDKAKKNPGLMRALALYDAGLRTEGFWEFNLQIAQMNDRELLAAATWAEKNQLYDRAIAAADKTEMEHDVSLRYLTPFRDRMTAKTQEVGIDESWVYGLIRQESRFVTIARSGVGASGLMQVMPATAQYVAKKIGLSDFKKSDISDIDTNLTLGTNYLKMVFDQHGQSPVLASAGYNAGPSRPSLWKRRLGENRVIEGAIFTELIPFDETRDYVKNVMSNTVAYAWVLNNSSTSLKQRLGIIRGSN